LDLRVDGATDAAHPADLAALHQVADDLRLNQDDHQQDLQELIRALKPCHVFLLVRERLKWSLADKRNPQLRRGLALFRVPLRILRILPAANAGGAGVTAKST